MNKKIQNKFPLPAANPAEDLETISRYKLSLLLDPALFEVRQELQRDKGIDLIVELKQDNAYTNFRFAIQLKSTNSTKTNNDNSISYPVDVANINYLLNYGMPAYYILYDHVSGNFFVQPAHKVFQALIIKHHPEKLPRQFSARFAELLTPQSITEIYTATLQNGMLLRRINSHLTLPSTTAKTPTGIVIDENNDVYSVEQNIEFIDRYGFELLNKHEFKRIIEIEQRTHPRTSASPTFNLVCGMAYFQHASLLKALEFLKAAHMAADRFDAYARSMLTYTFLQAKHMLGMIGETEFKKGMADLMHSENLGSFLEVEKTYSSFIEGKEPDEVRTNALQQKLSGLIAKEPDISGLRIRAYSIILEIEGKTLIHALPLNFVLLCGRVPDLFSTKTYKQWKELDDKHVNRLKSILKFSMENENLIAVGNTACDLSSWAYQKIYIFHTLKNWDREAISVKGPVSEEDVNALVKESNRMIGVIDGYKTLDHKENMVHGLSLRYEILHFAGKMDEADSVAGQIATIIEDNDLNGLKANFQTLVNGDLRHVKFMAKFTEHANQVYRVAVNNGIGEHFKGGIPKGGMEFIEQNIKWPFNSFFELHFPNPVNSPAS